MKVLKFKNLRMVEIGKMSIELYDSAGLLIWQSGTLANLDTWGKKFSLPQKEMYFISVQVGKEIFTKKILIIDRL